MIADVRRAQDPLNDRSSRLVRLRISSYRRRPQERQRPEGVVRQVHQPSRLPLLLRRNPDHPLLELDVLHENVSVDTKEAREEGLHGFKIAVGA
mgnify:CR=1 FL=1